MRKFYTFFILFLLGVTLNARPLNLNQAVERAVSARTAPVAKQTAPRSPATSNEAPTNHTWYGLPVSTWNTYKSLNRQAIQTQEKYNQLYNEFLNLANFQELGITAKQGTPDYTQILANTKYIYIGEIHYVPAIEQEIKQLLAAIRQANPGKKILLATEFLQVTHPLINPLHIHGKEWLLMDSPYNISELIDRLQMDALALDDNIIQLVGTSTLVKVGGRYVQINLDPNSSDYKEQAGLFDERHEEIVRSLLEKMPAWQVYFNLLLPENYVQEYIKMLHEEPGWPALKKELTQLYGPGNEEAAFIIDELQAQMGEGPFTHEGVLPMLAKCYNFSNLLPADIWGVLQRNYQWAKRIQAVEKDYDIVIVWGGLGHYDESAYPAIDILLAHPQAVLFNFTPLDEDSISSSVIPEYQEREESLQRQRQLLGLCSSTEPPEEGVDDFVTICPGAETIDFEKTFFIKGKEKNKASFSPQEKALLQQMQQLAPDIRIEDSIKEYYNLYVK